MSRVASGSAAIRDFYERYPCGGERDGDDRARKLPWWYDALRPGAHPGVRVVEVGCGIGIDLPHFARGARYAIGFDVARRPLRVARERLRDHNGIGFTQADACRLPLASDSVDVCYSIGVIHHIPRWRDALGEIGRVLRPGGTFLLLTYRRWCLQSLVFAAGTWVGRPVGAMLDRRGRNTVGPRAAALAEFALHPHVELLKDRTWLTALEQAGLRADRVERRDAWFPLDRIAPVLRRVTFLNGLFGRFLIVEARKR